MSTAIVKLQFSPLSGEELMKWKPVFEADRRLKDAEKIKEDLATKEQKWLADVGNHTFTTKLTAVGGYIYSVNKDGGPLEGMQNEDTPARYKSDVFFFDTLEEHELYEKLLETISKYKVSRKIWHNVDKINLQLYLIKLKYQLHPRISFQEVLGISDNTTESFASNIPLVNLQRYFGITPDTGLEKHFFEEVDIISKIYARTI